MRITPECDNCTDKWHCPEYESGEACAAERNAMITTQYNLRELCIKNDWFTAGTNDQYDKLFEANRNGMGIVEIAAIIWVCSDAEYADIYHALVDENKRYEKAIHELADYVERGEDDG